MTMDDFLGPLGIRTRRRLTYHGRLGADEVRHLVEPHLFFVHQVAREFSGRGVPFEDLLAEGHIGLVEAAHKFDTAHNVKFLTYAAWWIRKRILDFVTRENKTVRLTRYARDQRRDLRKVESRLRAALVRDPTTEELALATGLDPGKVQDLATACAIKVCSIDMVGPGDMKPLADSLVDETVQPQDEKFEKRRLTELLRAEIAALPRRERTIIESRFGLDGAMTHTFQELGDIVGVSRERARQIEHEALRRLRRRVARRVERKVLRAARPAMHRSPMPPVPQ
jgi:RNA polymerase primary sigma factor